MVVIETAAADDASVCATTVVAARAVNVRAAATRILGAFILTSLLVELVEHDAGEQNPIYIIIPITLIAILARSRYPSFVNPSSFLQDEEATFLSRRPGKTNACERQSDGKG
jgi:hypothetical protein